eukprot:Nk52_evm23s2356 gene=Nk52_evmTU23s2356
MAVTEIGAGEQGQGVLPPVVVAAKKKKVEKKNYSKLPEATQSYFARVEVMLDADEFEDVEDRNVFIGNVFVEIRKQELLLCFDQECSRILEKLLRACSNYHLRRFMTLLGGNYLKLCTNRYGSHVLQTILCLVPAAMEWEGVHGSAVPEMFADEEAERAEEAEDGEIPELRPIAELVVNLCKECEERLDTLMNNGYASHVFRWIIAILSGTEMADELMRSKRSRTYHERAKGPHNKGSQMGGDKRGAENIVKFAAHPEYLQHFSEVADKVGTFLESEGKLKEFATSPTGSPVLQALLLALKKSNKNMMKEFVSKLFKLESEEKSTADENGEGVSGSEIENILIRDSVGSHLMEKILEVMDGESVFMNNFYSKYLKKSLVEFATDSIANFVVQHFIANVKDVTLFKELAVTFKDAMEDVLASGNLGVVVKLTEGCIRFGTSQKRVMKALVKAFHCPSKARKCQLSRCLIHYMTQDLLGNEEKLDEEIRDRPVSLQGVLILQNLFKFKETENTLAVESLMHYSADALIAMSRHVNVSRVLDAFFSGNVCPKKKVEAFRAIRGRFAEMAMDKYASRVLETMWANLCLIDRKVVAEELVAAEENVKISFSGRFVFRNFALDKYKLQYDQWMRIQSGKAPRVVKSTSSSEESTQISAGKAEESNEIDNILEAIKLSKGANSERPKKRVKKSEK